MLGFHYFYISQTPHGDRKALGARQQVVLEAGQPLGLRHLHADLVLLLREPRALAVNQEEVLLRVIAQVQQAPGDGLAVLLPLARAEDHLGEVPHPADYGDVGQLLLGQDFGAGWRCSKTAGS